MVVRLDDRIKVRLDKLAKVARRRKSFLAADAISRYLELQEWQINEIKAAILEADFGQLTDHEAVVKRWKKKHAVQMDKKS